MTQLGTFHCWFAPPVQSQICNGVPSAELGPAASRHRLELVLMSWYGQDTVDGCVR